MLEFFINWQQLATLLMLPFFLLMRWCDYFGRGKEKGKLFAVIVVVFALVAGQCAGLSRCLAIFL